MADKKKNLSEISFTPHTEEQGAEADKSQDHKLKQQRSGNEVI